MKPDWTLKSKYLLAQFVGKVVEIDGHRTYIDRVNYNRGMIIHQDDVMYPIEFLKAHEVIIR